MTMFPLCTCTFSDCSASFTIQFNHSVNNSFTSGAMLLVCQSVDDDALASLIGGAAAALTPQIELYWQVRRQPSR